jgi:hypothetical protein
MPGIMKLVFAALCVTTAAVHQSTNITLQEVMARARATGTRCFRAAIMSGSDWCMAGFQCQSGTRNRAAGYTRHTLFARQCDRLNVPGTDEVTVRDLLGMTSGYQNGDPNIFGRKSRSAAAPSG